MWIFHSRAVQSEAVNRTQIAAPALRAKGMWQRVSRPGPDELHAQLQARLASLDELLPRLKEDVGSTAVSKRELMQARSCTALSCQFTTRQHLSYSAGGEYVQECLSRPSDECLIAGERKLARSHTFPRSWRAGAWRQRVATPNERCRSTSWDHVAARVFNNSNARPEQGVLRRPHRSEGLYIEATVLLNVTINT